MLTKIWRLRRVALLVSLALLASCTAESGVVEQSAERATAPEPTVSLEAAEALPESTPLPAPVTATPDEDPEPVIYATNENVFALDPIDGSALLLGRRDKQPAIRSFSPDNVANSALFWILSAAPSAFGSQSLIDGSALIRTDLRTGESVRFVELGEIDTSTERNGYRIALVSQGEILVEFEDTAIVMNSEFDYHRFDALTGEPLGSFSSSLLDPVTCSNDTVLLRPLQDGTVLVVSRGSLGILDLGNGTVDPLLPCDDWPTYGEYLNDDELSATLENRVSTRDVAPEEIAAQPLAPVPAPLSYRIVEAQGDYWWISAGAVTHLNDPTKAVYPRALVRFDPGTRSVIGVWPLGSPEFASLDAANFVDLHVIGDRVVLQLVATLRETGAYSTHFALLDDSGTEWSVVSRPGSTSPTIDVQPGSDYLLFGFGDDISLVNVDLQTMSLSQAVPVVDLTAVAALPAPIVPGVDPRRIWPSLRELSPDETVRFVPSQAMAPTVNDGDAVIASTSLAPQTGDLVLFRPPQGNDGVNDLLQRIVASGGQTISIVDSQLIVDGVVVDEPYLAEPNSTRPRLQIPWCVGEDPKADYCELPPDTFFMMGDNRLNSTDSRVYGPIAADTVVGVVVEILTG